MEIKNNKPAGGSEPRRFSAGRAAAKPGASSFSAALKKAASATPSDGAPARSDSALALPEAPQAADKAAASEAATDPGANADGNPAASEAGSQADTDAAFADHMDLVRFRLKTGYYASKAINDALSDKLSGYFDDLA